MGQRIASLTAWTVLLVVGLVAASPFFNRGLVGTGEAFNYSLSVADAIEQMRGGVLPPLAGQTEYAFNARIHPLRNAPYLYYLCAGIDLATFHRLSYWEVQNVSLVLSLLGALFACYGGLRWATNSGRVFAVFLSCVYALAPPLMGAAHTFDLFMTVHVAVFVPLAIAACVKGCQQPSFSNDAWLAAALAAAWLAHPPVAFWLTSSVILVRIIVFAGRPSVAALASGLAAAVLGLLLSGFVFVSAATLSPDLGYFSDEEVVWGHFPDVILESLRGAFPKMLLPISPGAGMLGDLQMGYVGLVLICLSLFLALRRSKTEEPGAAVRLSAIGCAMAALVLVIMDLPVPWVTHWAWKHVLTGALKLTTEWPMQRLYLVAVAMAVFAAGIIVPKQWRTLKAPRWLGPAAMLLALVWAGYQARAFITRGYANRRTLETTRSLYRPSNLDLTITSYAFVGAPPTYVYGVTDPRFEFRILRDGVDEIASPLASALASAPIVQTGAIRRSGGQAPGKPFVSSRLKLFPGHRYLLTFAFRVPPVQALLSLRGPLLDRYYQLPQGGQSKGFGMMEGERRSIPIWTDSDKPEDVEASISLSGNASISGSPAVFADFTLQDVDMRALPVRLESFLPLRFTVDAPQGGCTVETPRRFLPGFEALVNGKPAEVLMSPYRQAMIPLPPGRSTVELSYPGPWEARAAFWGSVSCWLIFICWRLLGSPYPSRPWAIVTVPASLAWKGRWAVAVLAVAGVVVAGELRKRAREETVVSAVGPVRVDFFLAYGRKNVNEPLLATGRVGKGVVVFVDYVDETHISLGADVWGGLFQSPPIEVDYSKKQTLVVSDGALFPRDNPRTKELTPTESKQLLDEIRVELNGKTVIHEKADTYLSTREEVLVGRSTFGSLTAPAFLGRIVDVERLPIPRTVMLPASRSARMTVHFPEGREGMTEPLLDAQAGPGKCVLAVTYRSPGKATLSLIGDPGATAAAAEIDYDAGQNHQIDIEPTMDAKSADSLGLSCTFDGKQVLGGTSPEPSKYVPILRSGLNESGIAGSQVRFLGPKLDLVAMPEEAPLPLGGESGMAVIAVTFPVNKTGRHEPIMTSGINGAGDFIYVVYEDDQHVRLGFDHWNGGGVLTGPIAVDYHAPHEIWISASSLYPQKPDDPAWQGIPIGDRERLRTHTLVALDGTTVINAAQPTYPSAPAHVDFGENRIGGSTADASFSGLVHSVDRVDTLRGRTIH
jgi:hypothetical protein